MADLTEFFDFQGSPEFEKLWEELAKQLDEPSSSSGKSTAEASGSVKTEQKGHSEEPSLLRTMLTKKETASPSLQNVEQKKVKHPMPLPKPVTLNTHLQNNVATERPFQRFSTHTTTSDSTTSCSYTPTLDDTYPRTTNSDLKPVCTYSPALDENYPSTSTDSFQNIEDSILTTFRRNNQRKFNLLESRFSDPNLTVIKEFKVLKALQRRISKDIQQSEIIVNYVTDKYGSEPSKKRVKFSSLC